MVRYFQLIIQVLFFILFVVLTALGKLNLWMVIFLIGITISLLFGRLYCGLFCPINSAMNIISWIKKKLNINGSAIPNIFMKPTVRYLVLGLFFIILLLSAKTGKKLPLLPSFITLGMIIALFFSEEMFHRFLCPFGTILHFTSSKSKHYVFIDEDKCNNCGKCMRVCQAKAVEKGQSHNILKKDCLVCMECSRNCKQNAISYK